MNTLLTLHSIVRWLVIFVAVVTLGKFALGMVRRAGPDKMDRGLMSGFSGLIDLQALLGITLVLWVGFTSGNLPSFIPHVIMMLAAVVLAHVPARWRKSNDPLALRNNLLSIVGVLALILIGVRMLPQGWFG